MNLFLFLRDKRKSLTSLWQKSSGKFDGKSCQVFVSLAVILVFGQKSYAATVSGEIRRIGDAVHLEFSGLDQWHYELDRSGNKIIRLSMPAFDDKTRVTLQTWKGHLINEVKVKEGVNPDVLDVEFSLVSDQVESFNYLTDDPSRLIIDFYMQEKEDEPLVKKKQEKPSEAKPRKAQKAVAKKVKKSDKQAAAEGYRKINKDRTPAGELLQVSPDGDHDISKAEGDEQGGAYDAGDPGFKRFMIRDYEIREEALIASRQNIYIRFPMLEMPTSELQRLIENPPEYVIKPKDTKENKEARLLLALYNRGRNSVFLKTFDHFTKTYPNSIYDEIVRHLAAEVHFKMWKNEGHAYHYDQFTALYRYLLEKYPDSPLAERTSLLLGFVEVERDNGMGVLQQFQRFLDKYPKSSEKDQARKAIAAGYLDIDKFDEALETYKKIENHHQQDIAGIEATYRKGDVFFAQRKYDEAISAYKKALKKYPHQESVFPNAHYNIAESHFWKGEYKKGLEHYISFLKLFPSHDHGGYAMTRIGEILEILGADTSRVMGAFLESYFRYRSNPGSLVARLRMLSQQMRSMKEKEIEEALEEMNDSSFPSNLPNIQEFKTLMIADGFHRRGDYERALSRLISYYQKNPSSSNLDFFLRRIEKNITDGLKSRVDDGNFMDALAFYGRYAGTWMKNSDRIDVPFLLGRAYELAGVFGEAEKIYQRTLARLDNIEGTVEEKERRVTEHLPSQDILHLRLASVAASRREFGEAYREIKAIQSTSSFTEREQVEKVEIAAVVAEEREDLKTAKGHLEKLIATWEGQKDKLIPAHIRLARLHMKTKDYIKAQLSAQKVLDLKVDEKKVKDSEWAQALELKGDALLEQNKKLAAVEVYTKLLENFDGKRPLGAVRYQAGLILFEQGDMVGAEKLWNGLSNKNDSLYKKLSEEKLKSAKWQDEYQKYIERIPAMKKTD